MSVGAAAASSELIGLLAELVSIRSVNPSYDPSSPGEGEVARYAADYLRARGIECELSDALPGRPNLIARVPGRERGRTRIFDAHLDTVSAAGMTIDPFRPDVREGRLYGRGSCDTKAGLAAMMRALCEVAGAGQPPPANVWLTATVDEEAGFAGVRRLVAGGLEAEAAVVAEPTELEVVVAHKGMVRFRIVTRGRAAHSSKPELGVNAIGHMARVIQAIETDVLPKLAARRHPILGSPTASVGVIRGGVQVNIVPERCEVEVDRRTLPGEETALVLADFEEAVAALGRADPDLRAAVEPPFVEDWALETAADAPLVRMAERVVRDVRGRSALRGVPYGTNASKFARAGIPSIVLGPGSIDRAHTAVEYVELEAVEQAARIYAGLMLAE